MVSACNHVSKNSTQQTTQCSAVADTHEWKQIYNSTVLNLELSPEHGLRDEHAKDHDAARPQ